MLLVSYIAISEQDDHPATGASPPTGHYEYWEAHRAKEAAKPGPRAEVRTEHSENRGPSSDDHSENPGLSPTPREHQYQQTDRPAC